MHPSHRFPAPDSVRRYACAPAPSISHCALGRSLGFPTRGDKVTTARHFYRVAGCAPSSIDLRKSARTAAGYTVIASRRYNLDSPDIFCGIIRATMLYFATAGALLGLVLATNI